MHDWKCPVDFLFTRSSSFHALRPSSKTLTYVLAVFVLLVYMKHRMSEELEAQSDVKKKVQFDLDYKESIVDIYMSTESLRVHDRPWVEATPPTPPRHPDSPPSGRSSKKYFCLVSKWIISYNVHILLNYIKQSFFQCHLGVKIVEGVLSKYFWL